MPHQDAATERAKKQERVNKKKSIYFMCVAGGSHRRSELQLRMMIDTAKLFAINYAKMRIREISGFFLASYHIGLKGIRVCVELVTKCAFDVQIFSPGEIIDLLSHCIHSDTMDVYSIWWQIYSSKVNEAFGNVEWFVYLMIMGLSTFLGNVYDLLQCLHMELLNVNVWETS